MRLELGSTVGPYRIEALVGAGGMGEVYRAHDARLGRDVAIKLLPSHLAGDAERLARFEREARTLAAVNHPHIAHVYGLEDTGAERALVLELVEGPTLAELIAGGLPLARTIAIAYQMATALDAAHEKGIIHRDLKPANIKVTPEGTVKVLDFGLAKLQAPGEFSDGAAASLLANSPTLTGPMATRPGMLLGTAAYMSPEQARGHAVDKRTDIWAFGLIVFEMLTGRAVFAGDTVSDTIAAVLRAEPDWSALPAATPAWLQQLLRRCLDRDPRHRLRDIGDAVVEIEEAQQRATAAVPAAAAHAPAVWRRALPWAGGLGLGVALTAAAFLVWPSGNAAPPAMLLHLVDDDPLFLTAGAAFDLSPTGTHLAYVADHGDSRRTLRVRPLHAPAAIDLAAGSTAPAAPYQPFFSPDGQWIGFVTSTELRKVPLGGGTSITIASADRPRGATWLPDDTIVFAPSPNSGLARIPAGGGDATPVTTLDAGRGEATHRWPHALPGGRAILFTSHTATSAFEGASLEVVDLATGARKVVQPGATFGRYLPTGHLLYVNRGTVFAAPFDLERLQLAGSPEPLLQNVSMSLEQGAAQLAFSPTGVMAFAQGVTSVPVYPLVWVDREGRTTPLLETPASYASPKLSPDERTLALTILRDGNYDVWTFDLEREVLTRITSHPATDSDAVWSADGRTLLFSSERPGLAANLFTKPADGSGQEQPLTSSLEVDLYPTAWLKDGRVIATNSRPTTAGIDIVMVDLARAAAIEPLVATAAIEEWASVSPDGRWLAYSSQESGQREIFVRSLQGARRWQVSTGGGAVVRWTRQGRELVYRNREGMMTAEVTAIGDDLRIGRPRLLFPWPTGGNFNGVSWLPSYSFADFDVTADGQRFVMVPTPNASQASMRLTVLTSWRHLVN